ncbi:MAG: hypothetical protein ACK4FB_10700 [Brevundimonas sp.]|uniref:hypothetical protein n=1 Tax=Brevundimonas sp. TaxID=1871086 RepID=UPI00391D4609
MGAYVKPALTVLALAAFVALVLSASFLYLDTRAILSSGSRLDGIRDCAVTLDLRGGAFCITSARKADHDLAWVIATASGILCFILFSFLFRKKPRVEPGQSPA